MKNNEFNFSIPVDTYAKAKNKSSLVQTYNNNKEHFERAIKNQRKDWPEYMVLKVVTVYPDNTFDLTTPAEEHIFERVSAIDPRAKDFYQPGKAVTVRFNNVNGGRPYIKFGYGFMSQPADVSVERNRLPGLWSMWFGNPGMSMQSGGYLGPAWVPDIGDGLPGSGAAASHPIQSTAPLVAPKPIVGVGSALYSAPIVYSTNTDGTGDFRIALLRLEAVDDTADSRLRYSVQIWKQGTGPDVSLLQLQSTTELCTYPKLTAHGTTMLLGVPADGGEHFYGKEFMPSRLHYVASTDSLVVLGPTWDVEGGGNIWVINAQTGVIRRKSDITEKILINTTVGAYSLTVAYWNYQRRQQTYALGGHPAGYISESDLNGDHLIYGYTLAQGSVFSFGKTWTFDPMTKVPGGVRRTITPCTPLKILGEVTNKYAFPYDVTNNTLGVVVSGADGLLPQGVEYGLVRANPTFDFSVTMKYFWASTAYIAATSLSLNITILQAETGQEKFTYTDTSADGYTNFVDCLETYTAEGEDINKGTVGSTVVTSMFPLVDVTYAGYLPIDFRNRCVQTRILTFPLIDYNDGYGNSPYAQAYFMSPINIVLPLKLTEVEAEPFSSICDSTGAPVAPGYSLSTAPDSAGSIPVANLYATEGWLPHNRPAGVFDATGCMYLSYAVPHILCRGDAEAPMVGLNRVLDGIDTHYTSYSKRIQEIHWKTYMVKINSPQAPEGSGSYELDTKVEVGESFSGYSYINHVHSGLGYDVEVPITSTTVPILEQEWALIPIRHKIDGKPIQELLCRLVDKRETLSHESRPILQVYAINNHLELLGNVLIMPSDSLSTDPNQYRYDCRGYGPPVMRGGIDTTVGGMFGFGTGGGAAFVEILVYYKDREDLGLPARQLMTTIVFNGEFPNVDPVITQRDTEWPGNDMMPEDGFDYYSQGPGGRVYYGHGDLWVGGY